MKVLHITPHLGGGAGKAHAAIAAALPKEVDQTFLLLESPRDHRFADAIAATGARVVTAAGLDEAATLAGAADIVQFEFWNHPRLFECLARTAFPAMRSVFWSHISGLAKPVIQPALMQEAGRFVFTTEASRSIPGIAELAGACPEKLTVINSGFGFANAPPRAGSQKAPPLIVYLGTVDFAKMHPGFFAAIDRLEGSEITVSVWGAVDPSSPVIARVLAMRHPERIRLRGHTADPALALSGAGIFFYPLQRGHYGTGENALIEAMSLGIVPVVLNNPAEMATVHHGETGFVGRSITECADLLQMLLSTPDVRERVSRNAIQTVAETRTPARSARQFMSLWRGLLNEPKRPSNFRRALGDSPADWFLATQYLPGQTWTRLPQPNSPLRSKGALGHFESVFPGDASLARLAAGGEARRR
jgi:glycosyltransferase involved in cell wall biosynthesis